MVGDWMKMRTNLWDDPRVTKLCAMTRKGEATVIGALYWLWAVGDQHSEDGCLPGYTPAEIDRKTGVKGFGKALVEIGWLVDGTEGVEIVRFTEHNGTSAKNRALTARRVANHKHGASGNAASVSEEAKNHESGNASSVSDSLAERYLERERELIPKTGRTSSGLWSNAIALLVEQGATEKSARSFIGLQLASYAEEDVLDAFSAASGSAKVQGYVVGVLKRKPKKAERPEGVEYRHGQATIGGFVA